MSSDSGYSAGAGAAGGRHCGWPAYGSMYLLGSGGGGDGNAALVAEEVEVEDVVLDVLGGLDVGFATAAADQEPSSAMNIIALEAFDMDSTLLSFQRRSGIRTKWS
jgi:hypothetical protein